VEIAPEKSVTADANARIRTMQQMNLAPEGPQRERPRHPGMHRTSTIDYAMVLSGEIDMLLDDSEIHLTAGNVVVQQATNHAWVNRGDAPCRIAFVLVDADA
jgi:oxalate decarboxylase/phosphoglucose isomerase-like protein (cupin superfamily)